VIERSTALARRIVGSVRLRLLLVNVLVLLVPFAGLEFARIHERQLLDALERDMRDQAVLVRALVERDAPLSRALAETDEVDGAELGRLRDVLASAAIVTRTRVRVLDRDARVRADSHADGPPEGPEPPAPTVIPRSVYSLGEPLSGRVRLGNEVLAPWPPLPERREIAEALAGRPSSYTRVREEAPSVLLFVSEPVRREGRVVAVVYVTRSTQPVLMELFRIRRSLTKLMALALVLTLLVTGALALSITLPLGRLARATRALGASGGAEDAELPIVGTGEIREVSVALSTLWRTLRARLRYITEFTADVAHELKSPLTSIRGAAEILRDGADLDPAARERFLRNIELDAERLDRLVSRLLELSRIDASREPFVDVDVDALLARIVSRTSTEEQPVRVLGRAGHLRGRETDLERAVLNLVENALRHGPVGEEVLVRASSDAGRLVLSVEDHGAGVPEPLRARLFERFFTTAAAEGGTGLGLAIVRSVAEAHGGDVRYDARHAPGARFVVSLPRRDPERPRASS
jgi:two-component system sensor histidine kinase ChvG